MGWKSKETRVYTVDKQDIMMLVLRVGGQYSWFVRNKILGTSYSGTAGTLKQAFDACRKIVGSLLNV